MLAEVRLNLNSNVYLKDPRSSSLGESIIAGSIDLIDEIGFEAFTFRKLAQKIGSTEASVYRYFESKHKLLLYLMMWYWRWMEYNLAFRTANIDSARERLNRAIELVTEISSNETSQARIDLAKLNRIVNAESPKVYLTKHVDDENNEGVFLGYKSLVEKISQIILEINPDYKYPHMLVSTIIEGAHHQRFFGDHLPRLTDRIEGEDSVVQFSKELAMRALTNETG